MSQRIAVSFDGITDRGLAIQAFKRMTTSLVESGSDKLQGYVRARYSATSPEFNVWVTMSLGDLKLHFDGDYRASIEPKFQQAYRVEELMSMHQYQFTEETLEDGTIRLEVEC